MNELNREKTNDDRDHVDRVTIVTLVHDEINQISKTNISLFATDIYAKLIVDDKPAESQLVCGATIYILPEKDAQSCDLKSTTNQKHFQLSSLLH